MFVVNQNGFNANFQFLLEVGEELKTKILHGLLASYEITEGHFQILFETMGDSQVHFFIRTPTTVLKNFGVL